MKSETLSHTLSTDPINHWLVIDDDAVFCHILKKSLAKYDYPVLTANDSKTALTQAKAFKPNHIILDLNIAEESGIHLIELLLAIVPDAKILMLTGYASIATAVSAVKLGAYHYLPKPCGVDEILKALQVEQEHQPNSLIPIDERLSLDHLEWEYIHQVLDECQGNISEAARVLKMHRRTLQRKLQKKRKVVTD